MTSRARRTLPAFQSFVAGAQRRYLPTELAPLELRIGDGPPKIRMFVPYNSPSAGLPFTERIKPGAFAKTIADKAAANEGRDIISALNHDPSLVLGRQANGTLVFRDTDQGMESLVTLDAENHFHTGQVAPAVKRGDVRGTSFGFQTVRDQWRNEEQEMADRDLLEVRLFDFSPVTQAAYPASSAGVRSVPSDEVLALVAGVDLGALRAILRHVRDGKVPDAARQKFGRLLTALEALAPEAAIDWGAKLRIHERQACAVERRDKTASVDGHDVPMSAFCYRPDPDKPSGWKLPVFDKSHAQNALARWNQTEMPDAAEKQKAHGRLLAACKTFGIDTSHFEQEHPRSRSYKRPTDGKAYDTKEQCMIDNQWADDPSFYCDGCAVDEDGVTVDS